MARLARVVVPGVAHHVTQRGNRRQAVFFSERDYQVYLEILADNCEKHAVRLLGLCLMPNHVHLIAVPEREKSLAKGLGLTHNEYARWLHVKQRQSGHLWQNRYYSCPLDDTHLWEAMRYVELNPVRAGLVQSAWEWPWSSARVHLGRRDGTGMLDTTAWRRQFDSTTWEAVLQQGLWEVAFLQRIRDATKTGRPLGSEDFVMSLEHRTGRRLRVGKRGRPPKASQQEAQMKMGIT